MPHDPSTLWESAFEHCIANAVQSGRLCEVIGKLKHLDISTVIPIISTVKSTLLITPLHPSDDKSIRTLLSEISSRVEVNSWKTLRNGDYWLVRGSTENGVSIDIATSILNSKPEEF